MSASIQQYIRQRLQQRHKENNFRSLKLLPGLVDLYSNDYLGFARDTDLKESVDSELAQLHIPGSGSTGSRLLSGNSEYALSLEGLLANFYHSPAALIFNSGFDANYGLLSSLPYRGDTILYDELVHASIHDGIRNSKASATVFAHNNLLQLEEKLGQATGLKYVVVESVYSMDGDFAPLTQLSSLCKKYDAGLIVDEAHATGIFGPNGEGRVVELGLENECLAVIHTFGKAIGAHGAVILCNDDLKQFLINYCRPFIFSTALPVHTLAAIKCAHQLLPAVINRRTHVFSLIRQFKQDFVPNHNMQLIPSYSPVQSVVVAGNSRVKEYANTIQSAGFDVRPILYPTVPKDSERIRICLHSFNTVDELHSFAGVLNSLHNA
jgi:8-amino-7-oxononanoate synthase